MLINEVSLIDFTLESGNTKRKKLRCERMTDVKTGRMRGKRSRINKVFLIDFTSESGNAKRQKNKEVGE